MLGLQAILKNVLAKTNRHPTLAQLELAKNLDNYLMYFNQSRLLSFFTAKSKLKRGIYVWGEVGRGKSMLLNLFFCKIKVNAKLQIHLHDFMLKIHAKLSELKNHKNPINKLAQNLASQYKIIYIDEFVTNDVADALLLAPLLQSLLQHRVYIFIASNFNPTSAYLGVLQRHKFINIMQKISSKLAVTNLAGNTDFREKLTDKKNFSCDIEKKFKILAKDRKVRSNFAINLRYGSLTCIYATESTILCDFNTLLSSKLAANDYKILIAKYHNILIKAVFVLDDANLDLVKRLITFIDLCYLHKVNLFMQLDFPLEDLYQGSILTEFARTKSRLFQMLGSGL